MFENKIHNRIIPVHVLTRYIFNVFEKIFVLFLKQNFLKCSTFILFYIVKPKDMESFTSMYFNTKDNFRTQLCVVGFVDFFFSEFCLL